jgi:hypothetical protein
VQQQQHDAIDDGDDGRHDHHPHGRHAEERVGARQPDHPEEHRVHHRHSLRAVHGRPDVGVQHDCAAATANFAGPWSGTYTCTDTCTNAPFGGSVQLTVTQDSTGKASCTDEAGTTFLCGGVGTDTLARR